MSKVDIESLYIAS